MKLIGDKRYFAFEIGDIISSGEEAHSVSITIDTWLNNTRLTCEDNAAYLPSYLNDVKYALAQDYTLDKFSSYLKGLTPEEVHDFILSTRMNEDGEKGENWGLEGDEIFPYYYFMEWGETTFNITSFIFPMDGGLCVTYKIWRDEHGLERKTNHIILQKEQILPVFLGLQECLKEVMESVKIHGQKITEIKEDIYGSLQNGNENLDTHIAHLKTAMASIARKEVILDPARLPRNSRKDLKIIQNYFKKCGIYLSFSA